MIRSRSHTLKPKDFFESNPKRTFRIAVGVLLALTLAMFYDVLFGAGEAVLSKAGTDLSSQFAYWRAFGFGELRQGNLALWNPHVFGGMPLLGGFQSALLYPPNWLFSVLPLPTAINWSIALHVYLLGVFMYLWTSQRGLHPLACLVSSACLMLGAPYFLHIYAGHLSMLCAMAWVPLLLLAIDGLMKKPSLRWSLLGALAVAMQVLAGHPQTVFFASVAVLLYAGLCLVKAARRGRILAGLAGMYLGGVALAAAQLLTAIQAAGEGARAGGVSYEYAAMFSFPPENFLTFLAPGFFGNMESSPYWGRCFLWEMSIFFSVTGLALAVIGAICGNRSTRRFSAPIALMMLLLALGSHTPLLRPLHAYIPGFNMFRGYSKFIFPASVFITMLAGIGLDGLIRRRELRTKVIPFLMAAILLVGVVAVCIWSSARSTDPSSWWQGVMQGVRGTNESSLHPDAYNNLEFIQKAGASAAKGLLLAAGTLFVLAAILFISRFANSLVYAVALLAVVEIFLFARPMVSTFDLGRVQHPRIRDFLAERPGEYRILNLISANSAMATGGNDLWGYEPGIVRQRYAQFMAFTQGQDPDKVGDHIIFRRYHPLYAMLRLRFMFVPARGGLQVVKASNEPMPRLQLLYDYKVITDRDEIFAAMDNPNFDPRKTVILETDPVVIKPAKTARQGKARVIDSSTDHLTIEADLPRPAILLITDTYSTGWRAGGLPGSMQDKYDVLPANYVLRAIPLKAGKHRILLEYLPTAFIVGKWISIVSVLLYACAVGWLLLRRSRRKKQEVPE